MAEQIGVLLPLELGILCQQCWKRMTQYSIRQLLSSFLFLLTELPKITEFLSRNHPTQTNWVSRVATPQKQPCCLWRPEQLLSLGLTSSTDIKVDTVSLAATGAVWDLQTSWLTPYLHSFFLIIQCHHWQSRQYIFIPSSAMVEPPRFWAPLLWQAILSFKKLLKTQLIFLPLSLLTTSCVYIPPCSFAIALHC